LNRRRIQEAVVKLAVPLEPGETPSTPPLRGEELEATLGLARETAVHPVVAHALLCGSAALPQTKLLRQARELRDEAVFRELSQRRFLRRVLDALRETGIESPMLLKGAALRETLYPEPWMRCMDDVDLLVREDESARAVRALSTIGLKERAYSTSRSATEQAWHSRTLIAPSGGTRVDLHTCPARPGRFFVDGSELRKKAVLIKIDGRAASTPSAEHMLVLLAIHQAELGGRGSWKRFVDLSLLMKRRDLQWTLVVETARSWGARGAVASMLGLLEHATGQSPPNDAIAHLSSSSPRQLLLRRLVAPEPGELFTSRPLDRGTSLLLAYWLPDRRVDRVRFAFRYGFLRVLDIAERFRHTKS